MSFATGSFRHLPRIPTYEEAEFVFKNIKPIRGRSVEVRPLGKRWAADKFSIVHRGDKVVCTLYGHSVLTFMKDERGTLVEVDLCGYDTITTRQFIARILSLPCYSMAKKTYVDIDSNRYYLPVDYTMKIQNNKVLNPATATKRVLDRDVTAQLREKYKVEMAGAASLLLLSRNIQNTPEDTADKLTRFWTYRREFLADITSEEMTDYLYLTAFKMIGYLNWDTATVKAQDVVRRALYEIATSEGISIYKEVAQ
jgi:hypothetical protein